MTYDSSTTSPKLSMVGGEKREIETVKGEEKINTQRLARRTHRLPLRHDLIFALSTASPKQPLVPSLSSFFARRRVLFRTHRQLFCQFHGPEASSSNALDGEKRAESLVARVKSIYLCFEILNTAFRCFAWMRNGKWVWAQG